MPPPMRSFEEFWPHYLALHSKPRTRAIHVFGTGCGIAVFFAGVFLKLWWMLPLGFVVGYFFAWMGHVLFEKNRPATLGGHAWWSFLSDFRLFWLTVTGRMGAELRRLGMA
jgi:hypothetical protein